MAASSSAESLPLDWEILSPAGPTLAMHVGCILKNILYIHGGITKYGSNSPSNKLYKCDLSGLVWNEVRAAGSPPLSHHACVTLHDRYMVLIGGWNGSKRVTSVYVFDTERQEWMFPRDHGMPEGVGLSSHTATVLSTGEIIVIGREGSLRLQRKHGNVYMLTGDIDRGEFRYSEYTTGTASRSGHTSTCVGNNIYIIGGRDDRLVEIHSGFSSPQRTGGITSKFTEISKLLKPLTKGPNGRKNHVAIPGTGALLLHGGETFDGRSREPVGELLLMVTKPHLSWYRLGNSCVSRANHVWCTDGERVIFHGGFAGRGVIYGDMYELKLKGALKGAK